MGIFIILITYVVIALPGTRGLYAIEGEEAELLFPYPCESTSITLRLNNRAPFYTSTNPESTQLPPNYVVTNQKDTRRGDSCTLHLTINPVSRKDEGTFILMSYEDGDIIPQYITIWFGVSYPPGKVSCELRSHFHEELVLLHCTAPAGSILGKIVCFQSGIMIPPLTEPKEIDGILNQNLVARVLKDFVYCCSPHLGETKDMCDCKDWGWDPVHNILTTHIDPCLSTLPSYSTPSHKPSLSKTRTSSSSGSSTPIQTDKDLPISNDDQNTKGPFVGKYVIFGIFLFCTLLWIAELFYESIISSELYVHHDRKYKAPGSGHTEPGPENW